MKELAKQLAANHGFVNGCWRTTYRFIKGLKLLASDTNGTSGIGVYQGRKLYWDKQGDVFVVEAY